MTRAYTKDELINELHRFVDENGRVPRRVEMTNENGYPSYQTYRDHFGSFNSGLIVAGLEINKKHHIGKLDDNETCYYCGKRADEIPNFRQWVYINKIRYCNKHGFSATGKLPDYVTGNLDINSNVGLGRAGEILVAKTLKIANEFDCNRISCGYKIDLYHDEYKKIDVKTCKLFDKHRWSFNFNAKKEANTYICIGLSDNRKEVEHVWIISNKSKTKSKSGITIADTYRSLFNWLKWEVDVESYNKTWKSMSLDKCKIMIDKSKMETEEEKRKHEEFKKTYFKKLGIVE